MSFYISWSGKRIGLLLNAIRIRHTNLYILPAGTVWGIRNVIK